LVKFEMMKRAQVLKYLAAAAFSLFVMKAFAQKEVPELWGLHVHDDEKALKQETIDRLENQLIAYEDSTSNQIAVLIIPALDGEVLEEYSLHVAEKWKLGQASKDNGVLLLVAIDDHKMRIEVGQGLEGVLTDALCNRIIRDEMAPEFRRNDYDAGVMAGIDSIIKGIGGEYTADEIENRFGVFVPDLPIAARIIFGFFVFLILGLFTMVALSVKGGFTWVLYIFLIPFYFGFVPVILGLIGGAVLVLTYVFGFPIAKLILNRNKKWQERMEQWKPVEGGSGGDWSSSGSSSSSSSSSSFSGGGGSFGGGGSSGGW
jgi:uncharacterized protein